MRSLLRLLKNKAVSSYNTKKTNEPSCYDRSPFASSPPGGEYSNISCADSASCQSHKLNALADLAQRISSDCTEYEMPPPASVFLSESKSMELEDSSLDYEPILITPWPFSSFAQNAISQNGTSSNATHRQKMSINGGFEFTLPQTASAHEIEQPVSTLYKWGTLESNKCPEEKQEESANNSFDNHYASWEKGEKTPFDIVETYAPFARREDSANTTESCLTPLGDVIGLNLASLQKSIKKAKPGSVLDLGGTHIVEDGSLQITTPNITLQNGILEIAQGLSVGACDVVLHDLKLIAKSSKAATLRVSKKDCCLIQCEITNSEGVGIQVTGVGTTLTMQRTTVHDCERSCVCVNRAGILKMSDGCVVRGSRSFHGISATDAGTELWIEASKIFDNFQDGIYVTSSAHAALENCEIYASHNFHGIAGKKFGTTIVLKGCILYKFKESALIVESGAKAKVSESSLKKCVNGYGVVADGHGSHVDILDTEISECNIGGVLIRGSASSRISRTHIFGSAYGNGVVVCEQGSFSRIMNSVIFQNCESGVLVTDDAKVNIEGCDISSSTAGSGVFVREDAHVILSSCQMSKNFAANVCADSGATCHAAQCKFDAARNGPYLMAKGYSTTIHVTVPEDAEANVQNNVYVLGRAKITVNDKKCRNRQRWPKVKTHQIFSRKLSYDTGR